MDERALQFQKRVNDDLKEKLQLIKDHHTAIKD